MPARIRNSVNGAHPDLIAALASDNKQEVQDAKQQLKGLYLKEFQATADIESGDYEEFYKLAKAINSALGKQSG